MPKGIFAGTFDPVHEGHVDFVANAIHQLTLENVFVVPERSPRRKESVTLLSDRVAMLRLAFSDVSGACVYEQAENFSTFDGILNDEQLSDATHLLLGSDVVFTIKTWPELTKILEKLRIVVGIRNRADEVRVHTLMAHLGILPSDYTLIHTNNTSRASSLARNKITNFHPKIQNYIKKHRLYKV